MCQEPLVKYGTKAISDCKANRTSKEIEETILAIIVTTGMVSNYVINDYNSCVAHAVCYGFSTQHHIETHHLHGELVSYGVLVQLMLDNKLGEIDKLLPFYRSIGLPTSYTDVEANKESMEGVMKKASEVPDINVAAFPINKAMLWDAVNKLEDYVKTH